MKHNNLPVTPEKTKQMAKINEKQIQKLIELFKGKLSISDRNYYENLERLTTYLSKYKEEIKRNTLEMSEEKKKKYLELHQQILEDIEIRYAKNILTYKLDKYEQLEEDFPEFRSEQLKLMLETEPSKVGAELSEQALSRHSLILQLQEAFFRFWMGKQKIKLQSWLSSQGNQDRRTEDPAEDLDENGLTLNQLILVAGLDGTLAAAEDIYGKKLALVLSQMWRRPANKVAECLKKLNGPGRYVQHSAAYTRDNEIALAFHNRYKEE